MVPVEPHGPRYETRLAENRDKPSSRRERIQKALEIGFDRTVDENQVEGPFADWRPSEVTLEDLHRHRLPGKAGSGFGGELCVAFECDDGQREATEKRGRIARRAADIE